MPPAGRMYYFLLAIFFSSAIQRINGASLKETLGSTLGERVESMGVTSGRV